MLERGGLMKKLLVSLCLAACAFGQYKTESAGAPPSEAAQVVRDALQKDGVRVSGPNGPVCEIWLRATAPSGKNSEQNASFTDLPAGALLGVIRFPAKGTDRRGQAIAAGVYTLRLSFFPVDGAHQGVSPTRDFLLLSPAAADTDVNSTPDFKQLVDMSRKASGTAHPVVLNTWKADSAESAPAIKQEGEDWVLYTKIGDRPIAIIVVGTYQG
jgi:hypothetical protein